VGLRQISASTDGTLPDAPDAPDRSGFPYVRRMCDHIYHFSAGNVAQFPRLSLHENWGEEAVGLCMNGRLVTFNTLTKCHINQADFNENIDQKLFNVYIYHFVLRCALNCSQVRKTAGSDCM
jgi:hypothetical protein